MKYNKNWMDGPEYDYYPDYSYPSCNDYTDPKHYGRYSLPEDNIFEDDRLPFEDD